MARVELETMTPPERWRRSSPKTLPSTKVRSEALAAAAEQNEDGVGTMSPVDYRKSASIAEGCGC